MSKQSTNEADYWRLRSMLRSQAKVPSNDGVATKFVLALLLTGIAGLALAFVSYQDGFKHGQSTCPAPATAPKSRP